MIDRLCVNCESFTLPLSDPHCRKCLRTRSNRPLWKQKENKKEREEKESKKVIIKKEKRVVGW